MQLPFESIIVVVGALAGTIAILWRAYVRAQDERLKEAREHRETLRSLYEMLERRKRP